MITDDISPELKGVQELNFKKPDWLLIVLFLLAFFIPAQAETRSGKGRISIRNDETLFTTFAFITVGSFEAVDKEKMVPIKELNLCGEGSTELLNPATWRKSADNAGNSKRTGCSSIGQPCLP
ncbi:MAG: hypothetical protein QME85_01410 [Candidatus Saccharicenans sp.]|nr:hypothetical protein [Candidatus Saccharicenans sp.]